MATTSQNACVSSSFRLSSTTQCIGQCENKASLFTFLWAPMDQPIICYFPPAGRSAVAEGLRACCLAQRGIRAYYRAQKRVQGRNRLLHAADDRPLIVGHITLATAVYEDVTESHENGRPCLTAFCFVPVALCSVLLRHFNLCHGSSQSSDYCKTVRKAFLLQKIGAGVLPVVLKIQDWRLFSTMLVTMR